MKHATRPKMRRPRPATGWSGAPWMLQHRKAVDCVLERIRAEGKNAALERSLLCPGFMVPPYVAWRLPRSARAMLRRNVLDLHSKVDHDLSRPLRFFFENGLEIRIIPNTTIELRAIYHVHPWLLHRSGSNAPAHLRRAPMEVNEETFSFSFSSWTECDPDLSNHEKMRLLASRQDNSADLGQAECFDATLSRHIQVSLPDRTIFIDRPEGCGFVLRHASIGRRRLGGTQPSPASPAMATAARKRLRSATAHVNSCIRALPLRQRIALLGAADLGPFIRLCEDGMANLLDWLSARTSLFRSKARNPSPEGTRTGTNE